MAFNQPKPNLPYMTQRLVGLSGGNSNDIVVAKAIDVLKSFVSGDRKTKPSKKMLDILEKHGVISKKDGGCSMPKVPKNTLAVMPVAKKIITGGVNRLKKAERWSEFSKNQVKDGIDLTAYGYKTYNEAMNPMQTAAVNLIKSKTKSGGSVKRAPSEWIKFVKAYSQKHNITYGEALKRAGPEYRKLSGKGYGSVGGGYNQVGGGYKNVGGGYGAAS